MNTTAIRSILSRDAERTLRLVEISRALGYNTPDVDVTDGPLFEIIFPNSEICTNVLKEEEIIAA